MLCPFDCPEFQDAAPFIWSVDSVALGMLLFNSVALISRTLYHFISLTCSKSLGDRLVAIRYCDTRITLFDVHTNHLYAQCWDPGWGHGVYWRWSKVGVLF